MKELTHGNNKKCGLSDNESNNSNNNELNDDIDYMNGNNCFNSNDYDDDLFDFNLELAIMTSSLNAIEDYLKLKGYKFEDEKKKLKRIKNDLNSLEKSFNENKNKENKCLFNLNLE